LGRRKVVKLCKEATPKLWIERSSKKSYNGRKRQKGSRHFVGGAVKKRGMAVRHRPEGDRREDKQKKKENLTKPRSEKNNLTRKKKKTRPCLFQKTEGGGKYKGRDAVAKKKKT